MSNLPVIIQGGMGAGISDWRLAKAVSGLGQLGVVSGTALDLILARRLQDGDPGGAMRHGLDHFPFAEMAERIWKTYYIAGGKRANEPYKILPMHLKEGVRELQELCIVANFIEVFLAREGHDNPVGINYLEKIQIPHLPSIYGAMLAGVGYVLMGAGLPLKVPAVLDCFADHGTASYPLQVSGSQETDDTTMTLVPRDFTKRELPPLARPKFLAVIASNVLAATLLKRANGKVDGFIVEGPTAGGHNAPPRGKLCLDESGQPIYGERDQVDMAKMRELGMPFWLAGRFGRPEKLREALACGAIGIQVGTAFAFCAESGLREDYKQALIKKVIAGTATVITDPLASPTGFPFKVALLEGSNSEREVYSARPRTCDLGYLRQPYRTPEGKIGYRCGGEPVTTFVAKGGNREDSAGKKCLCNALVANIGHPQVRKSNYVEQGLVTAGDDLIEITRFLPPNDSSYCAADVVVKLMKA